MVSYGTWAHLMLSCAYLVNSVAAAAALRFIVARAKKCWDFGATMYILHALATVLFDGFPINWVWWSIMTACMVATILLGEYLCVQFEMADIPIIAGEFSAPAVFKTAFKTCTHVSHIKQCGNRRLQCPVAHRIGSADCELA